ncbi:MAG: autotransporter domain-containing protein [Caulobacteraceae bacterium]|nr:autotransporter domain-containing protein [Caulobacteraceae bacterium]
MRLFYATAAALAPLLFAAGAQAQVVINTARTTPILTSNANNGSAANIEIASGGAINLTSGTAVTVDSDNTFTLSTGGNITFSNAADGATAVLVSGGVNTTITINDRIVIGDSLGNYPNPDNDLDPDGPFATGSGRYGVRLAGPVTGDVIVSRSGFMQVEGNDSFGIAIDDGLTGNLRSQGEIRVLGDRSVAIRSAGTLDGNAWIGGTVNATGEGSSAIRFDGDVTGSLILQANVQSTGYRYTSRPSQDVIDDIDADDRLEGGPTIVVGGNVGGGVLLDILPRETNADSTDDDGDGVVDSEESTSQVSVFGAAPAILVGSLSQTVTLGTVGTGDLNFGFINRGTISSQGILDGVDAQGVRFGLDGGQAVTIEGGVLSTGSISTLAYDGDATAIRFGAGVTTPRVHLDGFVTAASASDAGGSVTSVLIEAGASVPELVNRGTLLATTGGGTADVTAILDLSGTLTDVTNFGIIQANITPDEDSPVTGVAAAVNLTANTTGVTFVQDGVSASGATGDDADGDGVLDADEPSIFGDVLFGSGADVLDVRNGSIDGAVSFGAGADTLRISGGSIVAGRISDSDGQLSIDVQDGTLDGRQTAPLNISDLTVGSDGRVIFSVDGQTGQSGSYVVAGDATLADGAQIGVRFSSLIDAPRRFTVIDAATLNLGQVDFGSTEANSPYLFRVEASADVAAGDVYLDVRRRTAEEAGLISAEAGLFDSFYGALGSDEALLNAFISQTGREGFIDLYEQLLPDHSGGPLLSLAGGVDAVTRALVGRNASAAPGQASAWLQEITFYADKDKTDTYGFRSEGFGVAGGVEMGSDYGNLGVSLAFTSADLEDPESAAEEVVSASLIELGVYWRAQGQYWTTWARAAGGYATFDSTRRLVGSGLNLTNTSSWNGWTVALAGGASYERTYGRFTIRPEVYAEYFSLSEDAHEESGAGGAFDLEIDEREGHMFSAVAAMNVGMSLGERSWLKPELRLGWRQNISVDPGVTMGRFVGGGTDFAITPDGIEGGGPIIGFRLNVGNELGMLSISADAEMIEDYVRYMLLLRASFRF